MQPYLHIKIEQRGESFYVDSWLGEKICKTFLELKFYLEELRKY